VLGDVQGKHLLLPRSAQGTPELPAMLRGAGATVDELALYAPQKMPLDEAARQQLLSGVDAVTFASGSAVRAFVAALAGDARFATFWHSVAVACIGPTTADTARAVEIPVDIVATHHDASGLVTALTTYFTDSLLRKEAHNG
jgi:uroporphyrinogen-III synthase